MPKKLTPRDVALRAIPERRFQHDVEALLTLFGWGYYHAPDNSPRAGHVQRVRPGFPDICAWRGTRLLFAELKRETGRVTSEQKITLAALARTGVEVYLWRPSDMLDIRDLLAAATRPGGSPRG